MSSPWVSVLSQVWTAGGGIYVMLCQISNIGVVIFHRLPLLNPQSIRTTQCERRKTHFLSRTCHPKLLKILWCNITLVLCGNDISLHSPSSLFLISICWWVYPADCLMFVTIKSVLSMLPPDSRGECAGLGRGGRGPRVRGEEAREPGPGGHQHHLAPGHGGARDRAGHHRPQWQGSLPEREQVHSKCYKIETDIYLKTDGELRDLDKTRRYPTHNLCNDHQVLNSSVEDSALFTCILTRMETGETEAREELRLVIFDKRELTRVVVAKRMDDAVNSVDTINSFRIIIDKVLLALVLVQIGFSQVWI